MHHLSFKKYLKRDNTGCTHILSVRWVSVSVTIQHIGGTMMGLTYVEWTSSYEWYGTHVGPECSVMMDRANIKRAISRGGEHKAMSSMAHLSPYLPSLFTPSY